MATISRRLVVGAVAARLQTVTNTTIYYGQVGRRLDGSFGHEPPTKSAIDLRVRPYAVLFPGTGTDGPDLDLAGCNTDLTLPYQVTAAAGDIDDLLGLVDRIDAALHRWHPTVPGYVVGRLERPPGFSPLVLPDRAVTPERLFVPLQYVHTTTA